MRPPRSAACVAPQALTKAELVETRFASPGGSLDRRRSRSGGSLDRGGSCPKRTFYSVAALEPERAGENTSDEQEREGGKQHETEPERPQESGEQEPDPGECENSTTDLLAIG
jgi:hypothetical protein